MKPVTLYAGSDHYEVQRAAIALAESMAPEDPLNYEVLNAQADTVNDALAQIAALREAVLTLPFMGGGKVVWWKNVTFLADTPQGRSEAVLEALEKLVPVLQGADETVKVIISALGIDRRRAFFKALGKFAEVRAFDLPDARKIDPEDAIAIIESRLFERRLKAEPGVAERIFAAFGADKRSIEEAVEKLDLHAGEGRTVTAAEARVLVGGNREVAIWDFCDAVLAGRSRDALEELEQLFRQGESEIGILILLSQQIRLAALGGVLAENKLLRLVPKGNFMNVQLSPEAEAYLPRKKSGETVNTWQLGQVCQKSRKRPASFWVKAIDLLHRVHRQIVTGQADKQRAIELAVLELTA
ncbi:DNA polymerase III, delta subunit [Verrucomicrobium sp. GAS474]|uniref:DNA polymerase III subunit delta n=1 Tax=Verrucomicrobium sp. GAS474 TaxID=1882831 RepID=UPI00087DE232|nr:DNA polymerase III subunit delta [Verrucomicrobium sp. GAS474]SDU16709.1 DNA polymerase III, delta subunit [Verrucomicrobium sp. GAS474]